MGLRFIHKVGEGEGWGREEEGGREGKEGKAQGGEGSEKLGDVMEGDGRTDLSSSFGYTFFWEGQKV